MLGQVMVDKLHQPYRLPLIPGSTEAILAARKSGAAAAVLSGAGPSVIAFGLDNLYRLAEGSLWAGRGAWESEQVFVLEGVMLEQGADYLLRFRFDGEQLKLIVQDRAFMGPAITMTGTLQP